MSIAAYHGTDSYSFDGASTKAGEEPSSALQMTIGNLFVSNSAATGTAPASNCTLDVTGPAAPKKGDEVKGHFHCTDMVGLPVKSSDPSGYAPATNGIGADGDFDGFVAM